jgi:hypothetical protein
MRVEKLSISVRLRRVTTETAHVSVVITDELTRLNEDGSNTRKLDVDKVMNAALELGRLETTIWEPEEPSEIQLHPVQTAPDDRSRLS